MKTTITIFLLAVSLLIPSLAVSKTWTAGKTASYQVPVKKGLSYKVKFKVPSGVTFSTSVSKGAQQNDLYTSWNTDTCTSMGPAAANVQASSFSQALKTPASLWDSFVSSGKAKGKAKWAQFADSQNGKNSFHALHPSLKAYDSLWKKYSFYGFSVNDTCMSTSAAKKLVKTVTLTPVKKTYKVK